MEIIYLLIPIAMLFVALAIALFFWAVRSEQYADLDRAGDTILFDDVPPDSPTKPCPLVAKPTVTPQTPPRVKS
ncbi:MAG: cbb3-type cytochrome oxidase assembly protein CcoS [Ferrimonas sp.]